MEMRWKGANENRHDEGRWMGGGGQWVKKDRWKENRREEKEMWKAGGREVEGRTKAGGWRVEGKWRA